VMEHLLSELLSIKPDTGEFRGGRTTNSTSTTWLKSLSSMWIAGTTDAQALTAKRQWRQSKPCSERQVSWQETSGFVVGNLIERKTPGFKAGGLFTCASGGLGKP
jgi:hypothetical protein